MQENSITTGDLARMIQKGFESTAQKAEVNIRFDATDKRFDEVDKRLGRIENFLIKENRKRIERLEVEVKELKELLAVA